MDSTFIVWNKICTNRTLLLLQIVFLADFICFNGDFVVGFILHVLFVTHAVCVDNPCNLLQVASKLRGESCNVVDIGSR